MQMEINVEIIDGLLLNLPIPRTVPCGIKRRTVHKVLPTVTGGHHWRLWMCDHLFRVQSISTGWRVNSEGTELCRRTVGESSVVWLEGLLWP